MYIVLEGEVAIVKAPDTPDERQLDLFGPGEFVGEMGLLNEDGRRTASVRAVRDVQVLELTRADFDALLQRHPTLAHGMLRVMSNRLRTVGEAVTRDLREKNRQLTQAFDDLRRQNVQLAQAYADLAAAQAQLIEKEALERELRVARETQESILPRVLPQPRGVKVGARMVPAREVAGDFFDVFYLDDDTLGLVVGDVCDKGVPAAIFMALTRSLLRAEARRSPTPGETLRRVNVHLQEMNAAGMFVTVLYGVLRIPNGRFSYARAGHELPLVWDAEQRLVPITRSIGHPLGLLASPDLDIQEIDLPPGSTLLLYTDGATEAIDAQGAFFGLERLTQVVGLALGESAQHLCDRLIEALRLYRGTAPQADDITLLAVHRAF
jgi:serine phosphatase RsbU (regulator of sigma subunit)